MNIMHFSKTLGLARTVSLLALMLVPLSSAHASEAQTAPQETAAVFRKAVPENIGDLRAIEARVQELIADVTECTVSVRIGRAQGSGVIITKDGYILTAAHVSGGAGRLAIITLADGRRVRAKTLGANEDADASLLKIEDDQTEWPHAEMAKNGSVEPGDWCLAVGHPGGYEPDRGVVFRLGRVVMSRKELIQTDCPLMGGDSGGPLFDMAGDVIAIHSRIGAPTSWNFHVAIAPFRDGWDRMAASEVWGKESPKPSGERTVMGIDGEDHEHGCRITSVSPTYPAEKAGLQVGDVIIEFDGRAVKDFASLKKLVSEKKPGDEVSLKIERDDATVAKLMTLARVR